MNYSRMRPLPRICDAMGVRADKIEPAVLGAVESAISTPQVLKESLLHMADRVREKTRGAEQEKTKLINRRSRFDHQKKRLLDLYLDSAIAKGEYAERKAEIEEKTKELDGLIAEVSREIPHIDDSQIVQSVDHFLTQTRQSLGEFTPEKAQRFLRLLFDEITYDWKAKEVRLSGNIPIVGGDEFMFNFTGVTMPEKSNTMLSFELACEGVNLDRLVLIRWVTRIQTDHGSLGLILTCLPSQFQSKAEFGGR